MLGSFFYAAFFMNYDFKVTLFVLMPVFLVSEGLITLARNEYKEQSGLPTYNVAVNLFNHFVLTLVVVCINYFSQLENCILLITKRKLLKQQRQMNDLFMSYPEGIIVTSVRQEDKPAKV